MGTAGVVGGGEADAESRADDVVDVVDAESMADGGVDVVDAVSMADGGGGVGGGSEGIGRWQMSLRSF